MLKNVWKKKSRAKKQIDMEITNLQQKVTHLKKEHGILQRAKGFVNPLPTRAKHTKQPAAILNF